MKNNCFGALLQLALLIVFSTSWSQETPVTSTPTTTPVSKYDYHDAFGPFFYTKDATATRSASGAPGYAYWQNRADYKLTAKLNEKTNEIVGTDIVTYTNNSPDKMNFVWMKIYSKQILEEMLLFRLTEVEMAQEEKFLTEVIKSNRLKLLLPLLKVNR
jgi:hypothetical protein